MQTHKYKLYTQSRTQWVFGEKKTLSPQAMVKCCTLGSSCKKKAKHKLKPKSIDKQAYQSSLSLDQQPAKKAIVGQYLVCFPFLWQCQMLSHH